MQEFILTLVVIYVLFKIFGNTRTFTFTQNNYQGTEKKTKEGQIHIDRKPGEKKRNKDDDEGEYIDYEEIK